MKVGDGKALKTVRKTPLPFNRKEPGSQFILIPFSFASSPIVKEDCIPECIAWLSVLCRVQSTYRPGQDRARARQGLVGQPLLVGLPVLEKLVCIHSFETQ